MDLLPFHSFLTTSQSSHPLFVRRIREAQALGRWAASVGPLISKHSRALFVKKEILWVEVDHPVWRAELHYRKQQILELLNPTPSSEQTAGSEPFLLITDLRFVDPRAGRGPGR